MAVPPVTVPCTLGSDVILSVLVLLLGAVSLTRSALSCNLATSVTVATPLNVMSCFAPTLPNKSNLPLLVNVPALKISPRMLAAPLNAIFPWEMTRKASVMPFVLVLPPKVMPPFPLASRVLPVNFTLLLTLIVPEASSEILVLFSPPLRLILPLLATSTTLSRRWLAPLKLILPFSTMMT